MIRYDGAVNDSTGDETRVSASIYLPYIFVDGPETMEYTPEQAHRLRLLLKQAIVVAERTA